MFPLFHSIHPFVICVPNIFEFKFTGKVGWEGGVSSYGIVNCQEKLKVIDYLSNCYNHKNLILKKNLTKSISKFN